MTDKDTPTNNADDGGKQSDGGNTQGQTPVTFTQEQLDAILADRLGRQNAKFADYDDLKSAAAKWQEAQDDQKSDLDKLQDKLTAAEGARDTAMQQVKETLIRAAFVNAASQLNVTHPADAYNLADRSQVSIDDNGQVIGADVAVKALVDSGRIPVKGKAPAPNLNGSAGNSQRPGTGQEALTVDELAMAAKMGIKPEEYQKAKKA